MTHTWDYGGHDLLRRVRFQLRYIGQWRFSPPRSTEDGLWHARHLISDLDLMAPALHDLMDQCEQWEIMQATPEPQHVPAVPQQYAPADDLDWRVPGQHRRV